MTTASLEAQCPRHPESAAVGLCARCGSFVCAACVVLRQGESYCVDCAQRMPAIGGSWLAVIAGILSFLSLGCAPLGLVAIVLAGIDLVSIASGRKWGRQGLQLDLIAIGLSVVGLVLSTIILFRIMSGHVPQE